MGRLVAARLLLAGLALFSGSTAQDAAQLHVAEDTNVVKNAIAQEEELVAADPTAEVQGVASPESPQPQAAPSSPQVAARLEQRRVAQAAKRAAEAEERVKAAQAQAGAEAEAEVAAAAAAAESSDSTPRMVINEMQTELAELAEVAAELMITEYLDVLDDAAGDPTSDEAGFAYHGLVDVMNIYNEQFPDNELAAVAQKALRLHEERMLAHREELSKAQAEAEAEEAEQAAERQAVQDRVDALLEEAFGILDAGEEATRGSEVVQLLEEAEELGSSLATATLGELRLLGGAGLAMDFSEAMKYLNRSADQGYPGAQVQLGFMYALGLNTGVPDEPMAVLNYFFAALGGSPFAKMALGFRHLFGYGVPRSCDTAAAYYGDAAELVVLDLTETHVSPLIKRDRLTDETALGGPGSSVEDNDEEVVSFYSLRAEQGDVHGQNVMGQLNFYGARGVPQDMERAARYFRAAAEQGDPHAMANLGQMHMAGVGVKQDNKTALHWFEKSAADGNDLALNGLGRMHLHGYGVEPDVQAALKYFKAAAKGGNPEAQFQLGNMYYSGVGVAAAYQTALRYYGMAAHQSHTLATYNLARMHLSGRGTVRSCPLAVKLLKTVAERGTAAQALADHHDDFQRGDSERALVGYAFLAELGFELAQSNSAWLLDKVESSGEGLFGGASGGGGEAGAGEGDEGNGGGSMGNKAPSAATLAMIQFERAAAQGNVGALRMMGDYHYYGRVGDPNYEEAASYYNKAAQSRDAQSQFNMGYLYEHGLGKPQDWPLAKRWYDTAVETDASAYVPAKIALLNLQVKQWISKVWGGGEASSTVPSASSSSSESATPLDDGMVEDGDPQGASSSVGSQEEADGVLADMTRWVGMNFKYLQRNLWPLEDLVLLALCALFACIVYVRAQH